MPWSYDPTRAPADRFQWWDDPGQAPAPQRATWPGEPRHELRGDPAGDTVRLAAEFTAAWTALVRDALARLEYLDDLDRRRQR